jgi:O-antigen/teichoic acid export membrane protein
MPTVVKPETLLPRTDPSLVAEPDMSVSAVKEKPPIYREAMRLLSSSLVRRSFVYTASSSLSALTNFLLLPILTRYLSPSDYGIIETFLSLAALLAGVIVLGGNTSLSKDYFKLPVGDRGNYIGNGLGLITLAGLLITGVMVIRPVNTLLGHWLNIPAFVVFTAAVIAFAKAVASLTQTLFQLEKRAKLFAVFTNSFTLGELILSVFLVVGLGLQWRGRVTGLTVSYVLMALVALVWLKRHSLVQMFPLTYTPVIAKCALPLVIAQVASWSTLMVDRIIISHLLNPGATGLYSVGARFASVILMLETSFSLAWLPFFYENINKNNRESDLKIVRVTYLVSTGLIAISLTYGLLSRPLLYAIVNTRFYGAGDYIFLLSLAYCADGISKLFLGYLLHYDKSSAYSVIMCAWGALDIGLTYVFVKHFGPIGAAWGAFLSMLIGTLTSIAVALKTRKMPWLEAFSGLGNSTV